MLEMKETDIIFLERKYHTNLNPKWLDTKVGHQYDLDPQMSHEKKPPTFHYTGWLIGILIIVYYNPYINWVV